MFKQFFNLLQDGQVLKITILKKGSKLSVAALPDSSMIKDSVKNTLIPLTVTGTPEELNLGFWTEFSKGMPKAMGFISNAEQFSQSVDQAGKDLTKGSDKNGQSLTKNPSRTDKLFEDAERREKAGALPEALVLYRKIYNADKSNKKAADKIREIEEKLRQGNLFSSNEILQRDENQSISKTNEDNSQSIVTEHKLDPFDELSKLGTQTGIQSNKGQSMQQDNQPIDAFAALFQNGNTDEDPSDNSVYNSLGNGSTSAVQSDVIDENTLPSRISPDDWAKFQMFNRLMKESNNQIIK